MKVVITGCNHAVDFESLEEKVFLHVQMGDFEAEVETTEAGLHTVLELVGKAQVAPTVAAARTEAEMTMANLADAEEPQEIDGDGVIPFGLGGEGG